MRTKTESIMRYMPTGETYTVELFELHELDDGARDNAYRNWLEDYRESAGYYYDVTQNDVIHYGDKALASVGINAEWDSWDNCFPGNYADPYNGRYLPYGDAAEYLGVDWGARMTARDICHMDDYGYYSSMDMAEAFNAYEARLLQLVADYEKCDDYDGRGDIAEQFARLHREACEKACKALQNDYEVEREYLESFEHFEDETEQGYCWRTLDETGRVIFHDCRKWYTAEGEFYEQADVSGACVSIVKAS